MDDHDREVKSVCDDKERKIAAPTRLPLLSVGLMLGGVGGAEMGTGTWEAQWCS